VDCRVGDSAAASRASALGHPGAARKLLDVDVRGAGGAIEPGYRGSARRVDEDRIVGSSCGADTTGADGTDQEPTAIASVGRWVVAEHKDVARQAVEHRVSDQWHSRRVERNAWAAGVTAGRADAAPFRATGQLDRAGVRVLGNI